MRRQYAALILLPFVIIAFFIPLVNAQDLMITDSKWGIEHRTSIEVKIHGHVENFGLVAHFMPAVTATLYVNSNIYAQSTTYCRATTFAPGEVCWFGFHFMNLAQEPTSYSLSVGSAS
jgi:hypothetical protein